MLKIHVYRMRELTIIIENERRERYSEHVQKNFTE